MAEEAILKLLRERGSRGALQSEISDLTGYSKPTISYFLSKLEARGVVARRMIPKVGYRVWLRGVKSESRLLRIGVIKATEYPFVFRLKSRLEDRGLSVYIKAYDDAIALMEDLLAGKVDAGFSPLITQVVFYAASRGGFRIVASGASGGGSIVLRRGVWESQVRFAGSSMASTMDACLRAFLRERGLGNVEVLYFSNPEAMVEALEKGVVQMLSIWEPYASILEAKGHRRIARFTDYLGVFPCCVLAVSNKLEEGEVELLVNYLKDILLGRDFTNEGPKLSSLIGVDESLVKMSLREYSFHPEFSVKELTEYLRAVGLEAASSWVLKGLKAS